MSRAAVNLVHRVQVVDVRRLTPGMVRIVFAGPGLEGFVSSGVGDEYLRLFLPKTGHDEPQLPVPSADGYWEFPDGVEPCEVRTYTVRAWDAATGLLTIDFVVHEGGVAATWALGAQPGHVVGVNTPRGLYAPAGGIRWQLLVADATGLPAALRLAEQALEGVRTRVVLEVSDDRDEQEVELPAGVELTWVHGGNGHAPSRVEEIVRASEFPKDPGYVWVAGDEGHPRRAPLPAARAEAPGIRLQGRRLLDREREQWMARYEALPDGVREQLSAMWADETRDQEEVEDEYEAALEAHGLDAETMSTTTPAPPATVEAGRALAATRRRRALGFAVAVAALLVCGVLSLAIGSKGLSVDQVIAALGVTSLSGTVWCALLGAVIATFAVYAIGAAGRGGPGPLLRWRAVARTGRSDSRTGAARQDRGGPPGPGWPDRAGQAYARGRMPKARARVSIFCARPRRGRSLPSRTTRPRASKSARKSRAHVTSELVGLMHSLMTGSCSTSTHSLPVRPSATAVADCSRSTGWLELTVGPSTGPGSPAIVLATTRRLRG